MRYRTGDIEFDAATATIHGPRGAVPLRKQVAQTLLVLLTRAPALVSTDELLDAVWGRHAISPSAVPQAIRELRRLLGDQAQESTYIETRHRQGYRWLPPVEAIAVAVPETPTIASATDTEVASEPVEPLAPPIARIEDAPPTPALARWIVPALLAAVVLQALVFWLFRDTWWPQPTDAFAYTSHPAFRAAHTAFDEFRINTAEQALAGLVPDEVATQLLRARIAILRGDGDGIDSALAAARQQLDESDRAGRLWVDTIAAHAAGRDSEAWSHLDPLLALRPQDVDLKLLAWDLRRKIPAARVHALMADFESIRDIPASRRLLLAAQTAGIRRDGAMQREHAQRLLTEFGTANPAMAALASAELASAAELLRDAPSAMSLAYKASEALQALGLARPAVRSLRDAVWNARVQDQIDTAEQYLARMQQLLDGRRDPIGVITMRHLRAQLFAARGDHTAAIDAFTQLAADYEAIGDGGGAANALNSTVEPRYLLGRNSEVPAVIERALQLASRAQALSTVGFLHGSLGNHYVRSGDLQRGHDQLTRALESFRASGEKRAEAAALGNLSEVAAMRGRMDEAAQYSEQAVVLERSQNSPSGAAYAQSRLARVHAARGDLIKAIDVAAQSAEGFKRVGNGKEEAMTRATLGLLRLQFADLAGARAQLVDIQGLRDAGPLAQAAEAGLAGAIAFTRGDFLNARTHFDAQAQALQNADEMISARQAQLDALRTRLALNERVAVEEELRELLKRPETAQSQALKRDAQLLLAQTLLVQGRRDEAEAELSAVDTILAQAPDAEDALRVVLLRASLDRNQNARRERLQWATAQAQAKGLRLLALQAQGELAHDNGADAIRAWQLAVAQVQAAGLTKLVPLAR